MRRAGWSYALVSLLALCAMLAGAPARAGGTAISTYALSLLGKPALPPDFPYFPYVNPNAPKGGTITLDAIGSFDSFNPYILRGTPASGLSRVWDTLLLPSADEASTAYGLIARRILVLPHGAGVTFLLRHRARFQDGTPITAADVAWTFDTLRTKGKPFYRLYYRGVAKVVVAAPDRVSFLFRKGVNRELPLILGEMPVLPEHWFRGHDFTAPLSVPPVGSGPYRVGRFALGRSVTYTRWKHYWAADLPVRRGTDNFDRIRYEYFRDGTVALEAFKAGLIDFRNENVAKNWATAYDFPAVRKGLVVRKRFRFRLPTGMQGFAMNTRRAVFANRLVRHAMAEAFDFQWTNRTLFYGAYARTLSYFSNSDLASKGLPSPAQRALLEPFAKDIPASVFIRPFRLPITNGTGNNRPQLLKAFRLLRRAGYHITGGKLVDAAGKPFRFTILLDQAAFERVALPYVQDLKQLGVSANVRLVDPATYQRLLNDFDYDMTVAVFPESESPGNEQRDYWSCASARTPGSDNLMGVCNPAIDALISRIVTAPDRATLVTAVHALDRVLLHEWYMVPQWHTKYFRLAFWNKFGYPHFALRQGFLLDDWWVDPKLAAALAAARKGGG